ncbi:hypothetical protein CEXT_567541 [Caerostris extrusa]|uniref:Uncharacterized protein n=1 Tax=Caerostris extrusa TaxID=172846 RepID=A0AAV4NCW8_CAEEX|nr:hypothetical protein CEXT_567541 [Caerostris extrusa]
MSVLRRKSKGVRRPLLRIHVLRNDMDFAKSHVDDSWLRTIIRLGLSAPFPFSRGMSGTRLNLVRHDLSQRNRWKSKKNCSQNGGFRFRILREKDSVRLEECAGYLTFI